MATWNGAATLPKVLAAYTRLVAPAGGWTLLAIDDGSGDGSGELLAGYAALLPLRVLSQPRRGKNAALNLGLQAALARADADLFVFSEDDASPEPDWLLRIEQCAREHPDCALFGGAIVADWSEPAPPWVARVVPLDLAYGVSAAPEGPVAPSLVSGANMAVRRAVFEAGYRFDIALGAQAGAYAVGAETELNRRLGAAGYTAWFCAQARVGRFIRSRQVKPRYLLGCAFRQGRSAQLGQAPAAEDQPVRAMLARLARAAGAALGALAMRRWDALFQQRWECAYLRGYLFQSWFGQGRRLTRGARVVIAGACAEPDGIAARMAYEARMLSAAGCHTILADGVGSALLAAPAFFEQHGWRRSAQLRARLLAAPRLRKLRPDLVHVAFGRNGCGASLLWLVHHCRLPAVVSIHHAIAPARFTAWHIPRYTQAFSAVRGVYAVSPSAMAQFMQGFSRYLPAPARLCVIPAGVDSGRFVPSEARRAQARARLGLAPDSLVMGSVAPLGAAQRPDALLELFCALRNRFPALQLVLAGAGPLEPALRARIEALGLGAAVRLAGPAAAPELLLPAFDLHLLLGRDADDAGASLEAMACAVPAVATDAGASADILRGCEGGLLVAPHEGRAAIDAVGALLADPQRLAAMARHARAEVEQRYTAALMERRLREFYAGLLP